MPKSATKSKPTASKAISPWRFTKAAIISRFGTIEIAMAELGCARRSLRAAVEGKCPGVLRKMRVAGLVADDPVHRRIALAAKVARRNTISSPTSSTLQAKEIKYGSNKPLTLTLEKKMRHGHRKARARNGGR